LDNETSNTPHKHSHHNSYTRFKWAITEDNPLIKAYYENTWWQQHDYNVPI